MFSNDAYVPMEVLSNTYFPIYMSLDNFTLTPQGLKIDEINKN